jgi:hypothetical protein
MNCPSPHQWHTVELGCADPQQVSAWLEHRSSCSHCQVLCAPMANADRLLQLHYERLNRTHDHDRAALMSALPVADPIIPIRRPWRALWHPAVRVAACITLIVAGSWWGWREAQIRDQMAQVRQLIAHAGTAVVSAERAAFSLGLVESARAVERLPMFGDSSAGHDGGAL